MHSEGRYGVERGLVGNWRLMDSNEGVNDIVGTNNGTLVGGMGYSSGGGRRYAVFDGINDKITFPSMAPGIASWSLAFWVRFLTTAPERRAIFHSTGISNNNNTFGIFQGVFGTANCINLTFFDTNKLFTTSVSTDITSFHHIAVVRTAGVNDLILYVDGVAITGTVSSGAWAVSGYNMAWTSPELGKSWDVAYNNIYTSDFRYYNRALKAAEIARLARIY